MATRRLLAELIARFEEVSPVKVTLESVGGLDAAKRVRQGEAFDLAILAREAIDGLIADGAIVDGSRVDIVTSAVAVAVRAGSPHPDVSSADAVKRALLAAGSVGYSTGPSGTHLAKLFAGWGIADALADRLVIPPPGVPIGTLVARGELELGFQQLSELIALEGIEVAGLLPADIQATTTFSGGISVTSKERDSARQILVFMSDPAVAEIKRRHGMEPA